MNITAILLANALGLTLTIVIFTSNRWVLKKSFTTEANYFRGMLLVTAISCIMESAVGLVDGNPAKWAYLVNQIGNTWLYLANMSITSIWVVTVMHHLYKKTLYKIFHVVNSLVILGLFFLCINLWHPFIFYITKENIYVRGPFFWYFVIIDSLFAITAIGLYTNARIKLGADAAFFPVLQMSIPATIGLIMQVAIYGISTIWPFVSISLFGIVNGLQNELAYHDQLTGAYNRYYLDNIFQKAKEHNNQISCLMLDLNNFKAINDNYGHASGDKALIEAVLIFKQVVANLGDVCRYAGDEFVIILKTQNQEVIEAIVASIHKEFSKFNEKNSLPFMISTSIGSSIVDLQTQSIDDILSLIDNKMYENKVAYYANNPELDRRQNEN